MIDIPVHESDSVVVDDIDADLADIKWYTHPAGYARGRVVRDGKLRHVYMHRLILERMLGPLAPHIETDHIDGIPWNNRRSNLRAATKAQNQCNQFPNKGAKRVSHYKGVSWAKHFGKWYVRVGKTHVGHFADEAEAARAYDRKAREIYGEFAYLNFPDAPINGQK